MFLKILTIEEVFKYLDKDYPLSLSSSYADFCLRQFEAEVFCVGIYDNLDKPSAVLSLYKTKRNGLIFLEGAVQMYTAILSLNQDKASFPQIIKFIKKNFTFDRLALSIYKVRPNDLLVNIPCATQKTMVHVLRLPLNMQSDVVLEKIICKKTRNQIRHSYKENLEIETGDDLIIFYDLYLQSMQRLHAQPKELNYFLNLKEAFQKNFHLILAKKDNQYLGANLFVVNGNYLSLLFNVSLKESWQYCANDFLYWEMIKMALENNIEYCDFGINSVRDNKQIHFKESFGSKAYYIQNLVIHNSLRSFFDYNIKRALFVLRLLRTKFFR